MTFGMNNDEREYGDDDYELEEVTVYCGECGKRLGAEYVRRGQSASSGVCSACQKIRDAERKVRKEEEEEG